MVHRSGHQVRPVLCDPLRQSGHRLGINVAFAIQQVGHGRLGQDQRRLRLGHPLPE